MKALVKTELSKALKNKYFVITLIIATVLAVFSAMNRINLFAKVSEMVEKTRAADGSFKTNPYYPADTLYCYWISGEVQTSYYALFYLLIPVFAAFPFGWSYCVELKKGYVKNIVTRIDKKKYFFAKYIAVFVAGGLTVLIPLVVNFVTVACFVPATVPSVLYDTYTYVSGADMWASLFYTHPLVYSVLYMLISFIFGGLIAAISLAVTFFARNRIAVLLIPLFLMLCLSFASTYTATLELSPLNFLHAVKLEKKHATTALVVAEAVVLFAATFGITMWKGQKDDVF